MSNRAAASGSSFASSALEYERASPQVSGSFNTNFIGFGLGVGSISAIFGTSGTPSNRGVHRVFLGLGRSACDRVQRRMQRVPGQDRALDAGGQIAHAGENGEPAEMIGLGHVELA